MSRTLISITSFGGIRFLELAVRSLQETVTESDVDVLIVVAKPGDTEMQQWCAQRNFRTVVHHENKGFPASVNDCYDAAFVDGTYDYMVVMGNDVVARPGAIDTMIRKAKAHPEFDVFAASEYDSRFLFQNYPEARRYFDGPTLNFNDFSARPWELHPVPVDDSIQPDSLKDIRNLTLWTRRSFDMVGFDDVNYFPGGYFADNSYSRRCDFLGIRAAGLPGAVFYHAWSRTIHQGENRNHNKFFERNQEFFITQWGGLPGQERFTLPFDGQPYTLPGSDIVLPPTLEIPDRDMEPAILNYWRNLP